MNKKFPALFLIVALLAFLSLEGGNVSSQLQSLARDPGVRGGAAGNLVRAIHVVSVMGTRVLKRVQWIFGLLRGQDLDADWTGSAMRGKSLDFWLPTWRGCSGLANQNRGYESAHSVLVRFCAAPAS